MKIIYFGLCVGEDRYNMFSSGFIFGWNVHTKISSSSCFFCFSAFLAFVIIICNFCLSAIFKFAFFAFSAISFDFLFIFG